MDILRLPGDLSSYPDEDPVENFFDEPDAVSSTVLFAEGINETRIQRIYEFSSLSEHTRLSSLTSALATIPLTFLNLTLKVLLFALRLIEWTLTDLPSLCIGTLDKHQFSYKTGQLVGSFLDMGAEPFRGLYLFIKHIAGTFYPKIANYKESEQINKLLDLPTLESTSEPSPNNQYDLL